MLTVFCAGVDITSYIVSIKSEIAFSESTLIGNTPSESFTIQLNNRSQYFTQQMLKSVFTIKENGELRATLKVDELPEKLLKTLELTLYDSMLQTNVEYETNTQMYPCAIKDQLDEMSSILGLAIDYSMLPDRVLNQEVNWYDNTYTIRQHLGWIAELSASNVFSKVDGTLQFIPISKDISHEIENDKYVYEFTTNEEYKCTCVMIDQVVKKVVSGTQTKNTIQLSSDNKYVTDVQGDNQNNFSQEQIDYIYSLIGGLSFRSISGFKGRAIKGLRLGELVQYGEYFTMFPLSITTTYYSGDVVHDIVEISGETKTLSSEKYTNNRGSDKRIKKLEVIVDQNNQKMQIIASEQEGLNQKYGELLIGFDNVKAEVGTINGIIYKFETGNNNIFTNCVQVLHKGADETEEKYLNDMPLDISKDFLVGKDVVISVDIDAKNAYAGTLSGHVGAEFTVTYEDGEKQLCDARWYIGNFYLQYVLNSGMYSLQKRIWQHFSLKDKPIKAVSNLKMIISTDGEDITVAYPKVEIGTLPTGFDFDMDYIRDNITTLDKNFTTIDQKVESLTLQASSMTEQITTIQGEMSTVVTRLNSTEIKLEPTNILLAVNEKISADGQLMTTKFILDKNGVHISGGGLDISNNDGTKVLYADTSGNLIINNLTAVNGNFSGTITGSTISGTNIDGTVINGSTFKASRKRIADVRAGDPNTIMNIILGNYTPTAEEKERLDFTKDGYISALDYTLAVDMLAGASREFEDYVHINADDSNYRLVVGISGGYNRETNIYGGVVETYTVRASSIETGAINGMSNGTGNVSITALKNKSSIDDRITLELTTDASNILIPGKAIIAKVLSGEGRFVFNSVMPEIYHYQNTPYIDFHTNGVGTSDYTQRIIAHGTGNLQAQPGISNTSDIRLKDVIGRIDGIAAEKLLQFLNPIMFRYKDFPDELRLGLIAQEVEEGLCKSGFDESDLPVVERPNLFREYYALDYIQLIAILIKGWQIQNIKIGDMQNEISILKAQIGGK